MKAAGISPDLIRVSVGIESVEDIIKDFQLGLKAVARMPG
jgi:O-acetylhomoserine (thiol)-lyase